MPVTEHRADVAVVGGGIAGLVAAVRCAEGGLRPIVLEKLTEDRYVCNSRLTGGIFHLAYRSPLDDPDELARLITASTDGTSEPALVRAVATDARRVIRWLQSQGVRYVKAGAQAWQSFVLAPPAAAQIGRLWPGRGGDVLLRTLEARLIERGGRLLRGHRCERLTLQGDDCAGVEGVDAAGQAFRVVAAATVIADGGFQANLAALRENISPAPERVAQRNARTGMGDGMRMAAAAGAALTSLAPFYGHVLSADALVNDRLWPYPWADEIARSSIVVDRAARRFADEGEGGVYLANRIAALASGEQAMVIADDTAWNGPAKERALSMNPHFERAGGTIHRAGTIAELARVAGLPAGPLETTVAAYNDALARGRLAALDPRRSGDKYQPFAISKPPFLAIPVVGGITYTMGGIRIDGDARALRADGRPVGALYAAGSATGGLEGGPRAGYVGGLCKASVTALRAAEHILAARGVAPFAAARAKVHLA